MHHAIIELGTSAHAHHQRERAGMNHLVMELYHCNPMTLVDRQALSAFFEHLPAQIDMQRVSPVEIFEIKTSDPVDDGLSGFLVIATSHIAFHCWPGYQAVSGDVYSCEPFVPEQVLVLFDAHFQPRDSEVYLLKRGVRFPRVAKHLHKDG
jgi:S-adenosylmethionine decarboxylase